MGQTAITAWHEVVQSRNPRGLHTLLADDAVFHSPVVHTPQVGKAITAQYLAGAMQVFSQGSFRYVREIIGYYDAALEFEAEIDGVRINGIDLIKWNADNQIVEFKVMIRPLKAVNLIHQKMGALLQASAQPSQED